MSDRLCTCVFTDSHNHNDIEVFSPAVLFIYLVVYYVLAIITYGVKVPSGLFVPGIICGSTFGRIVGEMSKSYMYASQHGATCTTQFSIAN